MLPLFFGLGTGLMIGGGGGSGGGSSSSSSATASSVSNSSATASLLSDNTIYNFTPPGEGTHLATSTSTLSPDQAGLTSWMANMFASFTNGLLDTVGVTPANSGTGDLSQLAQLSSARPGSQTGGSGESGIVSTGTSESSSEDSFIRNGATDLLANMLSFGTNSLIQLYRSFQQRDYLTSIQSQLPTSNSNSSSIGA